MTQVKKNIIISVIILSLLIISVRSIKQNYIYETYISEEIFTLTRNISSRILFNQEIFNNKITANKIRIMYIAGLRDNLAEIYNDIYKCYELGKKINKLPEESEQANWAEINNIYFYLDNLINQSLLENGYETYYNTDDLLYSMDPFVLFSISSEDMEKLNSINELNTALSKAVLDHIQGITIRDHGNGFEIIADKFDDNILNKSFWLDLLLDLVKETESYIKEI